MAGMPYHTTIITARVDMGDDRVTPECVRTISSPDRGVAITAPGMDGKFPVGRGMIVSASAADDGRTLVLSMSIGREVAEHIDQTLMTDRRAYSLGFLSEDADDIPGTVNGRRLNRILVQHVGIEPDDGPRAIPREPDPEASGLANFVGGMRAGYLAQAERHHFEPTEFGFVLAGITFNRIMLYRAARRGDTAAAVRYAALVLMAAQSMRERRERASE